MRWLGALLLTGVVGGVLAAVPFGDRLEHNRWLFERWRSDPEHYARLRNAWRSFRGSSRSTTMHAAATRSSRRLAPSLARASRMSPRAARTCARQPGSRVNGAPSTPERAVRGVVHAFRPWRAAREARASRGAVARRG